MRHGVPSLPRAQRGACGPTSTLAVGTTNANCGSIVFAAKSEYPMDASARHLVFHGAIILLVGLLCGAPYGRAINGRAAAHIVHSWRVAHLSLPIGAILMFAVAPLLASFTVVGQIKQLIADLLIVSGYSFCAALPLAAMVGERGLSHRGRLKAKAVFVGNLVGAVTSLLASLILVYAAFESL